MPQSTGGGRQGGGNQGSGAGGRSRQQARMTTPYTKAESMAVARTWSSISNDPIRATNQTEMCFWDRIAFVYNNEMKPTGAPNRTTVQLRKKWERIRTCCREFAGIHQNNLRAPPSGASDDDVRNLSVQMYNKKKPRFSYMEEYEYLTTCPKFQDLLEVASSDDDALPKRTRLGRAGNYSSSSGGEGGFDLNDAVEEEPPATFRRRTRPIGQQRAARASRQAASSSRTAPASWGQSDEDPQINLVRQKHYLEAMTQWAQATDPVTKSGFAVLIRQLCDQLGVPCIVPAPGGGASSSSVAGASGDGAGTGDGEGEGEGEDEDGDNSNGE